jgi:hypothetical protein
VETADADGLREPFLALSAAGGLAHASARRALPLRPLEDRIDRWIEESRR